MVARARIRYLTRAHRSSVSTSEKRTKGHAANYRNAPGFKGSSFARGAHVDLHRQRTVRTASGDFHRTTSKRRQAALRTALRVVPWLRVARIRNGAELERSKFRQALGRQ